jgi:SAM-dependent methyltransferase
MGILFSFLPFLDSCYRRQTIQSPLLALGSLEIHEPEDAIVAFAQRNSHHNLLKEKSVRSLFLDRYGIKQYQDLDINEKADIFLDLNFPLAEKFEGTASTIFDSGTLEHIFDIRQALTNIHKMLKVGGAFIYISPLTWYNHAFFNFNPKLFHGLVKANGYEILVEGFWISQSKRRYFLKKISQQVYLTFDGEENPEVKQRVEKQFNNNFLPANALYMIAYRKENNDPFRNPYDE